MSPTGIPEAVRANRGKPQIMINEWAIAPCIASLVPSITELLAVMGPAPWLVARTGYCIHPG